MSGSVDAGANGLSGLCALRRKLDGELEEVESQCPVERPFVEGWFGREGSRRGESRFGSSSSRQLVHSRRETGGRLSGFR